MSHESLHDDAFRIATLDERRRAELISAYLDDELTPEQAREVTLWLDDHPDALREVEHHRRVWDMLEHYPDEPVPEDFATRVTRQVGALDRTHRRGVMIGLLAVAASILVAAIVGLTVLQRDLPNQEVAKAPAEADVLAEVPPELFQDMDLIISLSDDEFEGVLIADLEAP